MKIVLRILLAVLAAAVLILAAALLILTRGTANMELRLDDVDAYAASADFSIREDVRLNDDFSLDVQIGKAEIWALILSQYGENFEQTLSSLCAASYAEFHGIGMHISEEDGLYFDISYAHFGIPLGCRLFYDLSIDNGELFVTPVRLVFAGRDISPDKLFSAFDMLAETKPIALPDELSSVRPISVSAGNDALTVKYDVDINSIISDLFPGF